MSDNLLGGRDYLTSVQLQTLHAGGTRKSDKYIKIPSSIYKGYVIITFEERRAPLI